MSTRTFGFRPAARVLRRSPFLRKGFGATVVIWESLFPLALVSPRIVLVCWLAIGASFHLSCAVVMGLNTFVWAFLSAYPSAYLANQEFSTTAPVWARCLAVAVVGAALLTTLAVSWASHRRPLRRIGAPVPAAA